MPERPRFLSAVPARVRVDELGLDGRQPFESVAEAMVSVTFRADVVFPWNEPRKAIATGCF